MKYKNIKTGAIVYSSSRIVGKNWVEVTEKEKEGVQKTMEETTEYVEEEINLEEMTKAQLIDFANEHDIEVNDKDTKAVIIETIAKAFE